MTITDGQDRSRPEGEQKEAWEINLEHCKTLVSKQANRRARPHLLAAIDEAQRGLAAQSLRLRELATLIDDAIALRRRQLNNACFDCDGPGCMHGESACSMMGLLARMKALSSSPQGASPPASEGVEGA